MLHWMIGSIRKNKIFEVYAGSGIAICSTLLILGFVGWHVDLKNTLISQILQFAGNILYASAVLLVIITVVTLRHKGRPTSTVEDTTVLINKGIFGIIRHPLYLGGSFWAVGLMLLIQSFPSAILGILALICFWMASKKEDEFNVKKFGNSYKNYTKEVPMWNILAGLKTR